MRVLSKKIIKKLAQSYPQVMMVPPEFQELLVCGLVNMIASSSPDLPGIKAAEAISSQALEGLLTATTAKVVQGVLESVTDALAEIAERSPGLLSGEE